MADISISALGARQQKQVENARVALDLGNFEYAIDACGEVLKVCPASLITRQIQRVALLRQAESSSHFATKIRGWVVLLLGLRRRSQQPEGLIEFATKILVADPKNVRALKWLAQAANELKLPDTVVFALEAVRELRPDDLENGLALGFALLNAGRSADALRRAEIILKVRPVDADAQDLLRRASVAQTERDGKWTATPTAQAQVKAEQSAAAPVGLAAEVVTPGDWTQRLIDEALARVAEEPEKLAHYLSLIDGYRRLGRRDQALDWIRKARARNVSGADVTLDEQESELQTSMLEQRFHEAESMLARSPNDEELQVRCATTRAEWLAFRIAQSRRTLQRNPTEAGTRKALAALYLETENIDLAIAEYEQIEGNPEVRIAALIGLGRAFKRKKLFDQAIERFAAAKRELGAMDDAKKDVIYELGGCLLLKGEVDAAMVEFKSIHNDDVGVHEFVNKLGRLQSPG